MTSSIHPVRLALAGWQPMHYRSDENVTQIYFDGKYKADILDMPNFLPYLQAPDFKLWMCDVLLIK